MPITPPAPILRRTVRRRSGLGPLPLSSAGPLPRQTRDTTGKAKYGRPVIICHCVKTSDKLSPSMSFVIILNSLTCTCGYRTYVARRPSIFPLLLLSWSVAPPPHTQLLRPNGRPPSLSLSSSSVSSRGSCDPGKF